MTPAAHRLRKHADYQRVYRAGRKQFTRNMGYFYALRPAESETVRACPTEGPRVGLTVPKALGNAVVRNRIKRRMREAVRHALPLLQAPVDLVLHPRRVVLDLEFAQLEREVANLFRSVQTTCTRTPGNQAPANGDARPKGDSRADAIAARSTGKKPRPDATTSAKPLAQVTLP
jgi:ribonuclease P protein component